MSGDDDAVPASIVDAARDNWHRFVPRGIQEMSSMYPEEYYPHPDGPLLSNAPHEPPLTDSELIGVRGLLQERYEQVVNNSVESTLRVIADALGLDADAVVAHMRQQPPLDLPTFADLTNSHKHLCDGCERENCPDV